MADCHLCTLSLINSNAYNKVHTKVTKRSVIDFVVDVSLSIHTNTGQFKYT